VRFIIGVRIAKAEAFDRAWKLALTGKNFFLVDQIYHLEYSALELNTRAFVN
jgi:hypothetical protein